MNNPIINESKEILTNSVIHDINKFKNILIGPDLKFVPGEIIIKFKDEIDVSNFGSKSQSFKTGFVSVDNLNDKYELIHIEKLFGHGENILVIDDVKNQREIICHMLETLNYKAKSVGSGEEAVEYLGNHKADLLVLDMIMDPGINGREKFERIKIINPKHKAIIVSGFAEREVVKKTIDLGAGLFLKKPMCLQELGLAVTIELEK